MATADKKIELLEKNLTELRSTLNQYANDNEVTRQRSMQMIEGVGEECGAGPLQDL